MSKDPIDGYETRLRVNGKQRLTSLLSVGENISSADQFRLWEYTTASIQGHIAVGPLSVPSEEKCSVDDQLISTSSG